MTKRLNHEGREWSDPLANPDETVGRGQARGHGAAGILFGSRALADPEAMPGPKRGGLRVSDKEVLSPGERSRARRRRAIGWLLLLAAANAVVWLPMLFRTR